MLIRGDHNQRLAVFGDGLVDRVHRTVKDPWASQGSVSHSVGGCDPHDKAG
jgi:hypothetical protein